MRTEKDLQQYIKQLCKKHDILCYKFSSPSNRGVPDLLLITMSGLIWFVEVKTPMKTGRVSELQQRNIDRLKAYNCGVDVIDSTEDADYLIRQLVAITEEALGDEKFNA